ncbi:MAG: helix-turn-helix transcriptional regulator [Firmicutes bacterium]|nr:helix-turn-helix transcriptional regulator [Bacillota bacterium]
MEIKENVSKNITLLRQANGMTQAELAERLNYSDKAISKWERCESMPDIAVLKQIADLFCVTVDYLITEHTADQAKEQAEGYPKYELNKLVIALLSAMLVWFVASALFIGIGLIRDDFSGLWRIFISAIPVTMIVFLVFNSIWGNRKLNYVIISILAWSFLLTLYFLFFFPYSWQIMILGIPGQILIILWSRLRTTKRKINTNASHGKSAGDNIPKQDEKGAGE